MEQSNPISIPDKIIAVTNTLQDERHGEIREQLISLISELLNNDFNSLVQLLYRVDVDETKLKQLLHANAGTDAASIIADLIINRQLQKIATKKEFESHEKPAPGDSW